MLTHISLFTGIGGIDLAAGWAGFKTVLFIEIDEYCQKVLKKHWPDVPIIGDIRDVTKEGIQEVVAYAQCEYEAKHEKQATGFGESSSVSTRSNGTIPPITLITGGFPCQPVSQAGKRRGTEDDRWLWPEMLRVISEVRPTWVVAENVAGLLNMGFNDCLSDLEGEGYETIPFLIPACAVNAPHRRDRILIVGYTKHAGLYEVERRGGARPCPKKGGNEGDSELSGDYWESEGRCEDVADTKCKPYGNSECRGGKILRPEQTEGRLPRWQATERQLGREDNGLPGGMDRNLDAWADGWEDGIPRVITGQKNRKERLRCIGNAVVPQ